MTPSHRAPAIIPKIMQDALSKNELSRKRAHNGDIRDVSYNKSLPDSTKRNNTSEISAQTVTIDARELANISNSFRVLFRMIEQLKRPMTQITQTFDSPQLAVYQNTIDNNSQLVRTTFQNTIDNTTQVNESVVQAVAESEEPVEYENEEFNRSDDNVLITNKYDNQYNASVTNPANNQNYGQVNTPVRNEKLPQKQIQGSETGNSEWVSRTCCKTTVIF